jgi:hypothetical protein
LSCRSSEIEVKILDSRNQFWLAILGHKSENFWQYRRLFGRL